MAEENTLPTYGPGSVKFEGNVANDPKDISNSNDYRVVVFDIAVNGRNYHGDEWTTFYGVKVRGALAESAYQSIRKGLRVMVEGKLDAHYYEDKDGNDVLQHDINIDNFFGSWSLSPRFHVLTAESLRDQDDDTGSTSNRTSRKSGSKRSSRRDEDEEDEEDDDEEEEQPRRRSSRSSTTKRSSRRSTRDDDDDEEDDDEDEAPRSRSKRRSSTSASGRSARRASRRSADDDDDDDLEN